MNIEISFIEQPLDFLDILVSPSLIDLLLKLVDQSPQLLLFTGFPTKLSDSPAPTNLAFPFLKLRQVPQIGCRDAGGY